MTDVDILLERVKVLVAEKKALERLLELCKGKLSRLQANMGLYDEEDE